MPAIVAGAVAAAGTFLYAVVYVAASVALGALSRQYARMHQKTPRQDPIIPPPRSITVHNTTEPRQIIYGRVQTSGVLIGVYTHSPFLRDLSHIVAYAGHQCDGVESFEIDGILIKDSYADDGSFVPSGFFRKQPGGPVPSGTGGNRDRLNGSIAEPVSPLSINVRLGNTSTQTAISQLTTFIPEWTTNHKGYKMAYVSYTMRDVGLDGLASGSTDRSITEHSSWPNGPPASLRATLRGRRLYDPRKDTTVGGSGSHRIDNVSTWEFGAIGENTALCILDYITGGSTVYDGYTTPDNRLGLGEDASRIDFANFIEAANICDELVTVPAPVLHGAFNWTNGSTQVVGVGSDIYFYLAVGNYLIAPNGSLYLVNAINGSTQTITIASAYGGTTTTNAVTQYNTTASATTTQKRFTCNTQLSCTDQHSDNLTVLLSSCNGALSYSGGKYRLHPGVYSTPVESLTDADVLGPVTITTHPNGEDVYNIVTGKFIDPSRAWNENTYPSQTQSSYQTDDGDAIQRSFDYYATTDVYACQRLANVRLKQSRNKTIVTFSRLSPAATKISQWSNFYVTLQEFGWTNQVMRCLSWKLMPDGFIAITGQIESATTYDDLAIGGYKIPKPTIAALSVSQSVEAPTVLTATSQTGGILFEFAESRTADTIVQLWESSSSSPFSGATKIWQGKASSYFLKKADTTTRYYWLTHAVQGNVSSNYPASTGVAGNASQALQANSLTTTAQPGAIKIDWAASASQPPETVWELFEHTANTPFSSATKIWEGTALTYTRFGDTANPLYFWVRARTNSTNGAVYPAGNGVSGQGLAPTAPTGLTLVGFPTFIRATVDGSFTQGTLVQIHEHTANTPFSSSTIVAQGVNQNVFNIPRRDTTTRYYWATTKLSGQQSASFPSGNGTAGAAALVVGTDVTNGAVTAAPITHTPADGSVFYAATTQPTIESSGMDAFCTYTAPSTGQAYVDVSWSGQARISNGTSGVATGEAYLEVVIQVNGSTVLQKDLSIENYTIASQYGTFAGSWPVTVPAGQVIDAYFRVLRKFTTSGTSPSQTIYYRSGVLSLSITKV